MLVRDVRGGGGEGRKEVEGPHGYGKISIWGLDVEVIRGRMKGYVTELE